MTNEEMLMRALMGEEMTATEFYPQNNKQAYLAYAVGLLTDPDALPEPRTNEEVLLKQLCLTGTSGGGEGGVDLPALANPATAALILATYEAINQNGIKITGTMPNNGAVSERLTRSDKEYTIPEGYHPGTGKVYIETQEKTVEPTSEAQEVTPDTGKLLSKVIVEAAQGGGDFEITDCNYLFNSGSRWDIREKLLQRIPYIDKAAYMFQSVLDGTSANIFEDLPDDFISKLAKATTCQSMFQAASCLSVFPGIAFENPVVTSHMFYNAGKLNSVGDIYIPESLLNGLQYMFCGASNLETVGDITVGDMQAVSCSDMFNGCRKLKTIGALNFKPNSAYNMFASCILLEEVPEIDWSECSTIQRVFNGCAALKGSVNLGKTKAGNEWNYAFSGCNRLEEIVDLYTITTGVVYATSAFPKGSGVSSPAALKRLTFHPDVAFNGISGFDISYCCFKRDGMVELFNSLPSTTASSVNRRLIITGNPCIKDEISLSTESVYYKYDTYDALREAAELRYFGLGHQDAPVEMKDAQNIVTQTTFGAITPDMFASGFIYLRFLADTIVIDENLKLTAIDRQIATQKGWTIVE